MGLLWHRLVLRERADGLPKRSITIKDAAAYGLILTQGHGTFGAPTGLDAGDDPIRPDDGGRALRHGRRRGERRPHREPQRIGPARDAETLRSREPGGRGDRRNRYAECGMRTRGSRLPDPSFRQSGKDMHKKPALHNAMWPGLVGKGGPTPSRPSISTPCSTSRPPRGRTASGSTASICSSSIRTSTSIRPTTI